MENKDIHPNPEVYMDTAEKKAVLYELKDQLRDIDGAVVEVGSSMYPISSVLANKDRPVIGIDKEVDHRVNTGMNMEIVNADVSQTKISEVLNNSDLLRQNEIGGVVLSDILGYLPNWEDNIQDAYDTVKPNGKVVIFHKIGRGYADRLDDEGLQSYDQIKQKLESTGGSVQEMAYDKKQFGYVDVSKTSGLENKGRMYVVTKTS